MTVFVIVMVLFLVFIIFKSLSLKKRDKIYKSEDGELAREKEQKTMESIEAQKQQLLSNGIQMKYFGQSESGILAECLHCGKVLKIKRSNISSTETGYTINPSLKCPCGEECFLIAGKPNSNYIPPDDLTSLKSKQKITQEIQLKCPKCGSTNLTANTKGFGLGKAAVGGVLLGPVGLLGGVIGSKKPVFICLKCGNQFEK